MGVVSSEEIAAALTYFTSWAETADDAGEAPAEMDRAATTLRSHLSRLREEERFRDAARALCEGRDVDDGGSMTGADFRAMARLREIYRALEEPRDG